ncbi:MAG: mechanosensitive ion channel family protein [Ignavibacteriales bacterium]|nr:mechanosensitive ion channel family protein [Ignavibacteriales bacterium]
MRLLIWSASRLTLVAAKRSYGRKKGKPSPANSCLWRDKVMKIVFGGIGLAAKILDRYNVGVHSALVTLGVGSLAVGLALQDTLANMFGGFTIMLDPPVQDRRPHPAAERRTGRCRGISE